MKKCLIYWFLSLFMIGSFSLHVKAKDRAGLYYDDYEFYSQKIQSITSEKVLSYQFASSKKDKHVLVKVNDNKVHATGCGSATLHFQDGTTRVITVNPAPLNLLLILGQSNAEGRIGATEHLNDKKASQSMRQAAATQLQRAKKRFVKSSAGQIYNTYAPSKNQTTVSGQLWRSIGWYSRSCPSLSPSNGNKFGYFKKGLAYHGRTDHMNFHNLTNAKGARGKAGIDGSLAHEFEKSSTEKLYLINAAHSGTKISGWKKGNRQYREAVNLYKKAMTMIQSECKSGHYILHHQGVIWSQGEHDYNMGTSTYQKSFLSMWNGIKKEMTACKKKADTALSSYNKKSRQKLKPLSSIQRIGIIKTCPYNGKWNQKLSTYSQNDRKKCAGVRNAQNILVKKYTTIFMASTQGDKWTSNDSCNLYHPTVHYNQRGYNIIGAQCAKGLLTQWKLK